MSEATPAGPDRQELSRSVASGVRWTTFALFGVQGARIVFSLMLAAALGPTAFGIVGSATIYVALTSIFLDAGFGVTIIQRENLTDEDIGSVTWMNAALAVSVSAITVVAAPAIASFFNTPELTNVLRVLAITVLLKGLTVVPRALMSRYMRFRDLSVIEVLSTIVGGVVGIIAAYKGASYWALVIQTVTTDFLYVVGVRVAQRGGSWKFSRKSMREVGGYSASVMGSQFLWYTKDNADNLLIAKFLSPAALANYSLGYRVMMVPIQTFGQVVVRVMLPTFARLQRFPVDMARYFLRSSRAISLLTFPMMTGIILTSPKFIPWLIGPKWASAVVPMQFLAVTAAHQSVLSLGGPVLFATGKASWQLRFSLLTTVLSVASFAVGLQWGINGVAGTFMAVGLLLAPLMVMLIGRVMPITVLGWLGAIAPAIAACGVMSIVYIALDRAIDGSVPVIAEIAVCSGVGAIVYLATIWFVFPGPRTDMISMLRTIASGSSGGGSPVDDPSGDPATPPVEVAP